MMSPGTARAILEGLVSQTNKQTNKPPEVKRAVNERQSAIGIRHAALVSHNKTIRSY